MKLLLFLLFSTFSRTISQQCSAGQIAYSSLCLQFIRTPLDFHSAESICSGFSGHLVSIHNSIDNRNVASQAQQFTDGAFWVGAKAIAQDVTNPLNWYWTDGTTFDYQNYQAGQPTSQGSTSCMQVLPGTVCRLPANSPHKPRQPAPTPTIPSHCPSGYTWFSETDFCYKNFVRSTNFNDARSSCQADGGELASIHSQVENDFLVQFTKTGLTVKDNNWNDQVWIGYVYQNQKWQWTDGTNSTFVNWGDGEPNDMQKEWWTVLVADPHESKNSEATKWNNVGQIDERAFVCKRAVLH
ncbi:unnamed protein product [Caenorhabditis angaria]|uniref:C-type lectin domain-containing protein n=1 Tax=Caenorhabditis angaria TaxID=860376 RepID=A0A9P1IUJ8_9PELO|nr:unnamed protein product [Caenorhabditis angaria]